MAGSAALLLAIPLALSAAAGHLLPAPPCEDSGLPELAPGHHAFTFCHDGLPREILLHVPDPLPPGPLPLLLVLHGWGGSAEGIRSYSALDGHADAGGFLVAYPQGLLGDGEPPLRSWRAVHCCGSAFRDRTDDVGFLSRLLDRMADAWPLDASRIGVAGHSNGGMAAHLLAARHADQVTTLAVVAGSLGGAATPEGPWRLPPKPDRPVSVLILHALDDPTLPHGGGAATVGPGASLQASVDDAADFWARSGGVEGSPLVRLRADGVAEQVRGAGGGTQVVLLSTQGGHGWPGSRDAGPGVPAAPDASAEIARFLLGHPRAPASPATAS